MICKVLCLYTGPCILFRASGHIYFNQRKPMPIFFPNRTQVVPFGLVSVWFGACCAVLLSVLQTVQLTLQHPNQNCSSSVSKCCRHLFPTETADHYHLSIGSVRSKKASVTLMKQKFPATPREALSKTDNAPTRSWLLRADRLAKQQARLVLHLPPFKGFLQAKADVWQHLESC